MYSKNKRYKIRPLCLLATGLVCIFVVIAAGCVHTSPFIEEPSYSALGSEGELLLSADIDKSAFLIDEITALFPEADSVSPFINYIDRVSVAVILPELLEDGSYSSDEMKVYGVLEGNLSMPLINAALGFLQDWKRVLMEQSYYWEQEETGLQLYIPENGILFFAQGNIIELIQQTYVERNGYVPGIVSDAVSDQIAGIYIERPKYLFGELADAIPYSLLDSIEGAWLTLGENEKQDILNIYGIIATDKKSATTVISISLKKKYLEKLRTLETRPENWQESILVDTDEDIIINNMEIEIDELVYLLQEAALSMDQE